MDTPQGHPALESVMLLIVADFRAKSAIRVGVSAGAKPEQNGGAVEEEVLLACALSEKDMTGGFSLSSVRFAAPRSQSGRMPVKMPA